MKGIYVLLIELEEAADIRAGKRGNSHCEAGFYAYVGSGLGNLERRIARHLRVRKTLHWHIDYLLGPAAVRGVIYAETDRKLECRVASQLAAGFSSEPGFGSSDCRCPSHLFYCPDPERLREAALESLRVLKLAPVETYADSYPGR